MNTPSSLRAPMPLFIRFFLPRTCRVAFTLCALGVGLATLHAANTVTTTYVAQGIIYKKYHYDSLAGGPQEICVTDVNLDEASMAIRFPYYHNKRPTSAHAAAVPGAAVAINAQFGPATSGGSNSYLKINGTVIYDNFTVGELAVIDDGTGTTSSIGMTIRPTTAGQWDDSTYSNIMSSYKPLVQDGVKWTNYDMTNSLYYGKHPRTCIGWTYDNHMLMMVVDGRTPAATGMTIIELRDHLYSLGSIRHGVNLDGGGSSTMWIKNLGVVNVPSDGAERNIVDAIVFVPPVSGQFDQFETDAAGAVPVGYSELFGSTRVSTTRAFAGAKSLRILDTTTTAPGDAVKFGTASVASTLETMIYPAAVPSSNTICLSSGSNSNSNIVYHLKIGSTGDLQWYNGTTFTTVAAAGSVPLNAWTKLRISAPNTTTARVYVNDVLKGSIGRRNAGTTIDRVRFLAGSSTVTGDEYYLDNVSFHPDVDDDFEADAVGSIPLGYRQLQASVSVSSTRAYAGTRSLRIFDNSTTVTPGIAKNVIAGTKKNLEFRIYPVVAASGNMFSIHSGGDANANCVFRVRVGAGGTIQWYNGTAYQTLAPAGTVAFNTWSKIRVHAISTTTANVYVNDVLKGAIGKFNTFSTMDRLVFQAGFNAGTGDDFYVDNVSIY